MNSFVYYLILSSTISDVTNNYFSDGRNPLWLLLIFVAYLLAKAVWMQLDISREFRNGFVSSNIYVNFCVLKSKIGLGTASRVPCTVLLKNVI